MIKKAAAADYKKGNIDSQPYQYLPKNTRKQTSVSQRAGSKK
jgi:hypothetical protein